MITPILKYHIRTYIVVLSLSIVHNACGNFLSQNSRHDPWPMYTSRDPHYFLYQHDRLDLKGYEGEQTSTEKIGLALSVWGQNADSAKDQKGKVISPGNINGRWSMLGLLMGSTPTGQTLPPTLQAAMSAIYPTLTPPLTDPTLIDSNQQCGFFDVKTVFKNRGFRFDFSAQICGDIGFMVEGGVSDMCYTVTAFNNLTCSATSWCCENNSCPTGVNENLMCKLEQITQELGININDYHKNALEDFRFHLYWRHAYPTNYSDEEGWPEFLFMPFFVFSGSAATGTHIDPDKAFSLSSGSNGHNAIGATAGLSFDFVDTIELVAEGGFDYFFGRDFFNYRVPNSLYQSGIFPFTTDVHIKPGHNWHFGATLNAFHFVGRLSFYFQYIIVQHERDRIRLKSCDTAFKPELLEWMSDWRFQAANMGFNYDISSNMSLGFLWQAPLQERNNFRNTTLMFSFNATF